jgi:hypothetical protein
MATLICEVSEGARKAEATVTVKDYQGRREFLPVDRELIADEGGKHYLPVTIIHIDETKKLALVGLPVEADSGAHRIWVKFSQLHHHTEMAQ